MVYYQNYFKRSAEILTKKQVKPYVIFPPLASLRYMQVSSQVMTHRDILRFFGMTSRAIPLNATPGTTFFRPPSISNKYKIFSKTIFLKQNTGKFLNFLVIFRISKYPVKRIIN